MTVTAAEEATPTGRPPRIGPLFEWLVWGYAVAILVGETFSGRFATYGVGYVIMAVLSAILAVVAGLVDRFRPGGIVGWWTVFALIIGVLVVSAPTAGSADLNIPLLFATGIDATGARVTYIPLLQTFSSVPTTLFLTVAGLAFWALVGAWVLSLRTWRRAPRKKGEPVVRR